MWLDPSVADEPIWREHWAGVEIVIAKVAEDSIVLEAVRGDRDAVEALAGGEVFFHRSEVQDEGAPLRPGSAAEYALGEFVEVRTFLREGGEEWQRTPS